LENRLGKTKQSFQDVRSQTGVRSLGTRAGGP
jgi:hypothetical protein